MAKGRLAVAGNLRALNGRLIVIVAMAWTGLLAFAGASPAASCGWNPVCPYQGLQVVGRPDPAALDGPSGVGLTPGGDVVVADYSKQSIREFTASGTFVRTIGASGQFTSLHAIAVDSATGEIYAADRTCVYPFAPGGQPDGTRWCTASDSNADRQLTTIAAGPSGRLYAREQVIDRPSLSVHENIVVLGSDHGLATRWPVPSGHGDDVLPGEPFGVDGQGNVYLPSGGTVHEFDPAGNLIAHVPVTVYADAVEISGSTLYAESATSGGDDLTAYDLTGHQLRPTIALPDVEPSGQMATCCTLPITPAFVADDSGITVATTDHRIERLGLDGTVLSTWGSLSTVEIQPRAAVGDAAGNLYVVDISWGHARVLKYDTQGDPPTSITDLSPYVQQNIPLATATTDAQGHILINIWGTVVTIDTTGHVIGSVKLDCSYCYGQIATAPNGTIYATDWQDIAVLAPDGSRLATWPIVTPYLATDAAGYVYAEDGHADIGGSEIGQYDPTGRLVRHWPATGSFAPADVSSLAVGSDGRFYAAAEGDIRIFATDGTLLATWPYGGGLETGAVSVTPGGDVLLVPGAEFTNQTTGQFARYENLLNPLPPVPSVDESPWAETLQLAISGTSQPSDSAVQTDMGCSHPPGPMAPTATCAGTLTLSTNQVLGRVRFTVPLARRRHVALGLGTLARRLLGHHATVPVTLQAVYRTGSKWTTVRQRFTLRRHASAKQSGPQLVAAALHRYSRCVSPHVERAGMNGRFTTLRRFFTIGGRVSCRSRGGAIDDLAFRHGVVRRRALTAAARIKLPQCVLPSSVLIDELRIRGFDAVCRALRGRKVA